MTIPRWDRQFFESIPGRVMALLRWRRYTVEKLAGKLDLIENVIRSHLEDGYAIQADRYPLFAIAPAHPGVCRLAEPLLSEVIGVPVCEQCERGERPRCRFVIERADCQGVVGPA